LARISDKDVEFLIEYFDVETGLTELIAEDEGTRLFKVNWPSKMANVFILDSPEARALACLPHIVSASFYTLNLRLALKVVDIIAVFLKESSLTPLYLHVLRAAPGYMLHEALRWMGLCMPEVFVRPKYVSCMERDHREKRVVIKAKNFASMPSDSSIILVKPDTEATGRTSIESLREAFKEARARDSEIVEIILYGFISIKALKNIFEFAGRHGVKRVTVVALLDLAALASNDYDMVLYGPDEQLVSRGIDARLGAIIDESTFTECLPLYMPGMDQPGDWSARQDILFDGEKFVREDVYIHLSESLEKAYKLQKISSRSSWFRSIHAEAFKLNIKALTTAINRLGRNY